MKRVDVAVVGAGPAGTAAAILLAERGLTVVLLDRAGFLRPKVCGEYLSPQAARLLDRLGVLKDVDAAGAPPLRGMRLVAPDGTALCGAYPTAGPWRGYRDHAMAIPREVLDRILLERARSLPVEVRERHRVTGLIIEDDHVTGIEAAESVPTSREPSESSRENRTASFASACCADAIPAVQRTTRKIARERSLLMVASKS